MRNRLRPTGFNFTEVLFAVMILGVGFIMIAAIFPVALLQSKQTQEETAAASTARGGANYLEQLATNGNMPATGGEVHALDANPAVYGSLLLSADQRYAWVPFYRRAGTPDDQPQADWASVAQVFMVPVAVRNRSQFDKGIPRTVQRTRVVDPSYTEIGVPWLVADIVDAKFPDPTNVDGVDYIEFADVPENNTEARYTAVAEGSYVIVANAPPPPANPTVTNPLGASARIGHIFRIGNRTPTQPAGWTEGEYPRRWELVPGNDYTMRNDDYNGNGANPDLPTAANEPFERPLVLQDVTVHVVGRSLKDPSIPYAPNTAPNPNERDGNTQEVAAYTTFVNIR